MSSYTTIRIKLTDSNRIKVHLKRMRSELRIGAYSAQDIVTLALDSFEGNINKKKGISTARTEEIPKTTFF